MKKEDQNRLIYGIYEIATRLGEIGENLEILIDILGKEEWFVIIASTGLVILDEDARSVKNDTLL